MRILSFGEIIWDVYPDRKSLGGAPLNFAMHCAARGAEAAMISSVGDDGPGYQALDIIEMRGVDARYVAINSTRPTGLCRVTLDENKIPSYDLMQNTSYDNIRLSEGIIKEICNKQYDAISFGTLIQRSPTSRKTLRKLVRRLSRNVIGCVFCDVNLRADNYDADSAQFCLKNATALKVSLEEAPALTELGIFPDPADGSPLSLAKALFDTYPQLCRIAMTDGERGAYSMEKEGELLFCPAPRVKVVSTVGAGDSFGAAWLVSLFSGDPPMTALKKAVNYSADVISGTVTLELHRGIKNG